MVLDCIAKQTLGQVNREVACLIIGFIIWISLVDKSNFKVGYIIE